MYLEYNLFRVHQESPHSTYPCYFYTWRFSSEFYNIGSTRDQVDFYLHLSFIIEIVNTVI